MKSLDFPAGEQVHRPGFDGVVETLHGNEFVPRGTSFWEMGTNSDPKSKAESDFGKRSSLLSAEVMQNAAFVFVTLRTWQTKDVWAEEKRASSDWRGVLVLDSNDLEHWFEIAPAVDIWFARRSGHAPTGVEDLPSHWAAIRGIAEYPLLPSVFTASREAEAETVRDWLSGEPDSMFMQTYGLTDALDFLAALSKETEEEKLSTGGR